jgi:integrase
MTRRKELFRRGRRGALVTVRECLVHGAPSYQVQFRDADRVVRSRFFARPGQRAEAMAFAEGVAEEQRQAPAPKPTVTLEGLWALYWQDTAPGLRPRSQTLYREHWRRFALFAGPHLPAVDMDYAILAAFRAELEAQALAVSHIRRLLSQARVVFRWGVNAGVLPPTTLTNYVYRPAKERLAERPAEYRLGEFRALMAALKPTHGAQWRPWVALTICGTQGARQGAVLHLRWEDVDWAAGTVTWRRAFDKTGTERSQPMRDATKAALRVAEAWTGGGMGWVLPGYVRDEAPYTIQALWAALRRAEERSGVTRLKGRAGHGLRRLLAGEVNALTGDAKLAMDAIGDRDIRQAERYLTVREDRIAAAFVALDAAPQGGNEPKAGVEDAR